MDRIDSIEPMYVSSIGDLVISVLVSVSGIFVNWKFLKDMNNDDRERGPNSNGNLIKDVITTHTKTGMIFLPTVMILFWFLNQDIELPIWIQYSLCNGMPVVGKCFRIYFGFTSLVVASMRYVFIVRQNKVFFFGIEKAKTLFYYGSIVIPVVLGILSECTIRDPVHFHHSLCVDPYPNSHNSLYLGMNITQNIGSPMYSLVHQYIPNEITYYVGVFVGILKVLIFLNLVEGILYWRTFTYIKR